MTGRVRPARPGDEPRLRAIQAVVLAEPWPELLAIAVDGPPVCLVYADPEPTGYALCVVDADGVDAYLAELAVADGYRGEGRGSTLVAALVERLREAGVERLRATVRSVDERARSFYADVGFEESERLPDHYAECDGVAMVREL